MTSKKSRWKLRAYRKRYDDARSETRRKWRQAHPEIIAGHNRRRTVQRYGITVKRYTEFLIKQDGLCAACRRPESVKHLGKIRRLAIDHNHATGRIRGLLCGRCNGALGLLGDDILRVRALVAYMERYDG